MITIEHVCTKGGGVSCPLIQRQDTPIGEITCQGCLFDNLKICEVEIIDTGEEWELCQKFT